jgi:hypothetical protein
MNKLNSLADFNHRVCQLSNGRTRKQAWELVEKEYYKIHGKYRFASYNSFKSSISRLLTK